MQGRGCQGAAAAADEAQPRRPVCGVVVLRPGQQDLRQELLSVRTHGIESAVVSVYPPRAGRAPLWAVSAPRVPRSVIGGWGCTPPGQGMVPGRTGLMHECAICACVLLGDALCSCRRSHDPGLIDAEHAGPTWLRHACSLRPDFRKRRAAPASCLCRNRPGPRGMQSAGTWCMVGTAACKAQAHTQPKILLQPFEGRGEHCACHPGPRGMRRVGTWCMVGTAV